MSMLCGHVSKIYGALQESDYVIGVSSLRETEPSLEERIYCYQMTGKFQDALGCYEGVAANITYKWFSRLPRTLIFSFILCLQGLEKR